MDLDDASDHERILHRPTRDAERTLGLRKVTGIDTGLQLTIELRIERPETWCVDGVVGLDVFLDGLTTGRWKREDQWDVFV